MTERPIIRLCIVDGCGKSQPPKAKRGLCHMHYNRWRRTGTTEPRPAPPPKPVIAERSCSVPGCAHLQPRKSQRDLCNMHYSRWRRTGSTDAPLPKPPREPKPPALCRVDGCGKLSVKWRYCPEHYRESMIGVSGKCSVDGCTRPRQTKGFCKAHYVRARKGKLSPGTPIGKNKGDRRSFHPMYTHWKLFLGRSGHYGYEICDRWKNDFWKFVEDMGSRPTRRHTLIRIDEEAPYSPDNCMWATAAERHAKNMKVVSLAALQSEIIKPGIEKFLLPLAMYRGTRSLGRIHRLWNFAIAMMKTECTSLGEGTILSQNEEYAQLCGPENQVNHIGLHGFFSRLRLNPKVTDNVDGLTEYAEWLVPRPFDLTPVALRSVYKNCAPWRIYEPLRLRKGGGNIGPHNIKSADLCYPYVVWEKGNDANTLVALVHAVVPRGLPEEIRADVCQDLIVDLLAGDLSKDALVGSPRKYVGQKLKNFRWYDQKNDVSLDTELIDVLQYDASRERFDEFVSEELETIETSDPFKDYVQEKLSGTFRVTRQGREIAA